MNHRKIACKTFLFFVIMKSTYMCSAKATPKFKQLRQSYGFDEVAIVPGDVTLNPDQTNTDFHIGDFTFSIPIITSAMDPSSMSSWRSG